MKFLNSVVVCAVLLASTFAFAVSFDDLFHRYQIEDRNLTPAQVAERNIYELDGLYNPTQPNKYPRRQEVVSRALAEEIFRNVSNHPVASLAKYSKYDPQDQGIGFCFGRAMTVHLESLFKGVSKDSIKKLWALGRLKTGNTNWRYHVTTLLKSEGQWLAIDPIWGRVVSVQEWYRLMKDFDSDNKMRLYITQAEKFGPSNPKYHKSELLDPFYNDYFADLLAYYRRLGKELTQK